MIMNIMPRQTDVERNSEKARGVYPSANWPIRVPMKYEPIILTCRPTLRPSNCSPPSLSLSKRPTFPNTLSLSLSLKKDGNTKNLTSMAQKTGPEETEFNVVPDNIALCVKCGVAGNSAANNLCQKCFSTPAEASISAAAVPAPASGVAKPKIRVFGERSIRSSSTARSSPHRILKLLETSADLKEDRPEAKREVNRCSGCSRRVGLTGFRCRCGELFCAEHRYSDRHDCSYDYKTAGREAIARENPLVRAAKIVKI
ncbi:zinc finger A20 and AN1 domain-containing stress-associated protein 5-like [Salvia splendens]|uniref:zinc finger A20 and AN1 domain-containing stress-associated protein 5-like n=1 Tax=Salvia splendens TaxID=180675 RepID=UPI001C269592|nr:zinc finger A20 and AN1 domain-containing stress-associated protein 5-like [Salvia splendens]